MTNKALTYRPSTSGGLFCAKKFVKKFGTVRTIILSLCQDSEAIILPHILPLTLMNIQKYIGPNGQPTHICFSFHIVAHNKTNWATRLEQAISQSRIRATADVEIINGRIVADKNMVKAYLLFPKSEHTVETSLLHVTSFANVLGVHDFAAAGSLTELNFINA